jgi:uncharacterized protein YjbJ (UPF0337 family)
MENHINWESVEAHWDDFKDRVKHKWNKLTDDDMRDIHGDRYRLMQALQDRYEITRDKVEKQVSDFLESNGTWIESVKQRVMEVTERGKQYVQENSITDMTSDLRCMIRKNPIRTTLISIGIGYMLGRVLSMGSRS